MQNPHETINNTIQTNNDSQEINVEEKQLSTVETQQNYVEEIADLKSQIEILQDKLFRTVAESENSRKRLEKLIENAKDYSIIAFAKDLLSVSDNLSRALEHKPQNINDETANIIAGVEMTKDDLARILQKHGLESIEPSVGEKFDCNIHHAISQIVTDEYTQDSVIATIQLGYKIKDRLLRPAIVQVSKKV